MFLPVISSDHLPCQFSSLAATNAARADATFLSKASSSSAVDFVSSRRYGGAPGGAISNSSRSNVWAVQLGMFARWVDRPPRLIDLSWGFQLNLSSGTRSRVLRVFAIS